MVAYPPLAPLGLIPVQMITQAREGPKRVSSPMVYGNHAGPFVSLDSDSMTCFLNGIALATEHGILLTSSSPVDLDVKYLASISLLTTKNKDLVVDFSYSYPECEKPQDLQPHFVVGAAQSDGLIRGEMMTKRQLEEELSPAGSRFSLSTDQISSESLAPLILSVFIKLNERTHAAGSFGNWSQMTMQDQREIGNRKIVRALRNVLPPGRFKTIISNLPHNMSHVHYPASRESKR